MKFQVAERGHEWGSGNGCGRQRLTCSSVLRTEPNKEHCGRVYINMTSWTGIGSNSETGEPTLTTENELLSSSHIESY